jgi:drug/metabolite transporter (DMT)-like permease
MRYHLPALVLAFWRNLLVCVALFPALWLWRRAQLVVRRDQLRFYGFYGLLLAVFNSLWALSVKTNGAAVATVLAYSSAGFTALLALWLFKEKLGWPKIIAVSLSLIGCVLVSNAYSAAMWQLNPLGIVSGLLTGLLFAGYTLMGKEAARRGLSAWTGMLYSFAVGAAVIGLFNLLPFLPETAPTPAALFPTLPLDGWLILLALAFGPTVLGFGLYNASLNYLPASITNLLATLEPAMTAIEAYVFLNERLTGVQLGGGAILLAAVLIVQLQRE